MGLKLNNVDVFTVGDLIKLLEDFSKDDEIAIDVAGLTDADILGWKRDSMLGCLYLYIEEHGDY